VDAEEYRPTVRIEADSARPAAGQRHRLTGEVPFRARLNPAGVAGDHPLQARDLGAKQRADIPSHAAGPLLVISIIGGLIIGWIAIGEGELVAGLLMLACGVNVTACIGLGVVLLSINSIFLTLIHL
jgi:hypothetical protein